MSPLLTSSFARWMSYPVFIAAVAFCSFAIRVCAWACSISASACFNSDCFSWIVRCSVDGSNCTTTSPGFTIVPFLRASGSAVRLTAWATRARSISAADLPRISSVSTNGPFVTSAVGRSGAVERRTAANARPQRC